MRRAWLLGSWVGGIVFDLLPQQIHLGLNRVSGDTRAIASDLGEQGLAADHVGAATVEVLENRP